MKLIGVFYFFLVSVVFSEVAPQRGIDGETLRTRRNEFYRRIDAGDFTAFNDAATLPVESAISFLWIYADLASQPVREAAARAALKKVPGADRYFANRLADNALKGIIDAEDFRIMTAIGTPEIAAVTAPYLFDFYEIPAQGDMLGSVTALSAALALNRMYLPDAPVRREPKFSYRLTPDDVVAWQKWAVAKGFVPKEWNARVGQGEVLKQWQESERREYIQSHPTPEPTATPFAASTPSPEPLSTPIPATPVPAILAIPTLPASSETPLWPWAVGIVALAAILVAILKYR